MKRLPQLQWVLGGARAGVHALFIGPMLIAGILLLLHWKQGLDTQRLEHERRLQRAAQLAALRSGRPREAAPRLSAAGAREVNAQIALLNRDWAALLEHLAPRSPEVKLLAVDANPATGAIRIIGSATASTQANAYAEGLQGRGVILRNVRLLLLERKPGHTQFEVTAQWNE